MTSTKLFPITSSFIAIWREPMGQFARVKTLIGIDWTPCERQHKSTGPQFHIPEHKQMIEMAMWVHSSVVRAADCRSAGPWFKSGCALLPAPYRHHNHRRHCSFRHRHHHHRQHPPSIINPRRRPSSSITHSLRVWGGVWYSLNFAGVDFLALSAGEALSGPTTVCCSG